MASLATTRCGRTVWIVVLSSGTRSDIETCEETRSLLLALPGRRHLVTDYGLHETTTLLDGAGLLGAFHSVVERGPTRARDPCYLARVARGSMGVLRHQACVYLDADAGAVVAAMLLGWSGCLIAAGAVSGVYGDSSSPPAATTTTTTRRGILVRRAVRRPERRRHRDDQSRLGCGAWYTTRFPSLRRALHHYVFGTVVRPASLDEGIRGGGSPRRRRRVRWKDDD